MIRDGKLVGATLVGDVRKVSFLTQAFDSGLPLPDERVSLMFDIGTPDVEVGVAELADDAQVCNCNGVTKGALVACVRGGDDVGHRGDGQDQGGQGLRLVQAAGRADRRVGGRRGGHRGPVGVWYVPGVPYDKPTLMRHDPRTATAFGVLGVRCPGARRPAGREFARWGWRRCWR